MDDGELLELAAKIARERTREAFKDELVTAGLYTYDELEDEFTFGRILVKQDFIRDILRDRWGSERLTAFLIEHGYWEDEEDEIEDAGSEGPDAEPREGDNTFELVEAVREKPQDQTPLSGQDSEDKPDARATIEGAEIDQLAQRLEEPEQYARSVPDAEKRRWLGLPRVLWGLVVFLIATSLAIFVILFGNNQCSQPSPPPWIHPVLDIACPDWDETKDETSEPEPNTEIIETEAFETGTTAPAQPSPSTIPDEELPDLASDPCKETSLEISEIMFIPMAPQNIAMLDVRHEYVEIHNYGDKTVDAARLWIADTGGHPGRIVSWSSEFGGIPVGAGDTVSTELPPGGYAVILPADYTRGEEPYSPDVPQSARVLTLQGTATIGNGLVATEGNPLDVVVLYQGTAERINCVISTYGTPRMINEGSPPTTIADDGKDDLPIPIAEGGGFGGFYRVHPSGEDSELNWQRFHWFERTPGMPPSSGQ